MKKVSIILGGLFLLATAFTLSNVWKVISPEKVIVNFKLVNNGTQGTFTGIDASFDFDETDISKSHFKATVNVNSISTQDSARDAHLLNEDFFDATKYPTITFVSTGIDKTKEGFLAKGNLTMKDQTHPIEVPFTFMRDKAGNGSFKGTMLVSPSKFGVTKGEKRKDEMVSVSVEIPFKL